VGIPPIRAAPGEGMMWAAATKEGSAAVDFADPKGGVYVGEGEQVVPLATARSSGPWRQTPCLHP
jgi:hypothetical protein